MYYPSWLIMYSIYSHTVAPSHVMVSGPSEARVGDPVPLTCTTAPSNPRAEIRWMVGGQMVKNVSSRTMVSPEGGWITTSNITSIVEANKRPLVVICHGINMQLSENIVSTHTVNILCMYKCFEHWDLPALFNHLRTWCKIEVNGSQHDY